MLILGFTKRSFHGGRCLSLELEQREATPSQWITESDSGSFLPAEEEAGRALQATPADGLKVLVLLLNRCGTFLCKADLFELGPRGSQMGRDCRHPGCMLDHRGACALQG